MGIITDYFVKKSEGLIKIEPEALNYGNNYSMANTASPEIEVLEFLFGLVKILKPQAILETGTAVGLSCMWMAQGLKENGVGIITTIEYNNELIIKSEELWTKLGLLEFIKSRQGLSLNFQPDESYDLIFLDTEPEIRFEELVKFYPNLKPGGFVFIHDLSRDMSQNTHNIDHPSVDPWPFGPIPKEMQDWINDKDLVKFHFPTPRGLVGFYKRHTGDYEVK